jgi:Sulfotransferase family
MLPNFLCIGAQKSGTTWLYHNLKNHPQIWLPPIKENYYFSERECQNSFNIIERIFDNSSEKHWYNKKWRTDFREFFNKFLTRKQIKKTIKNLGREREFTWYLNYLFSPRNDRWYTSLFDISEPDKIRGDINPGYSSLTRESVENLHRLMPDAKIILLLRNPITRAWSHACMNTHNIGQNIESMAEEELKALFNCRGFVELGDYPKTLETWQSYYPYGKQLFVGFFEEIDKTPESLLANVCDFIGVESPASYLSKINKEKVNVAQRRVKMPKNLAVYLARMYYDDIKLLEQKFGCNVNSWLKYAEQLLE